MNLTRGNTHAPSGTNPSHDDGTTAAGDLAPPSGQGPASSPALSGAEEHREGTRARRGRGNEAAEVGPLPGLGEWKGPLLLALGIVAAARLLLSLWAGVTLSLFPTTDLQAQYAHTGVTLQAGGLAAPWQREDALWYEKIASQGYDPNSGTTAFLPLLPLLMRAASLFTGGNIALAGIVVSSLAAVAALALLFRLALLGQGRTTATRSALYLGLFPTAFFLYSAFTESLFLALAVAVFLLARRGAWGWAALLAAFAGLTKVQGALLCIPLAAEYLGQTGWRPAAILGSPRRALGFGAAVASGPLATAAFFGYIRFVVGDPVSWSERQNLMWHHRVTWPGETLAVAVGKAVSEGGLSINTFDLAVFALFCVLTLGAFRLRASYGLQALTVIVPSLLHVGSQFPLMSFSRYALAAFPCFIALAAWTTRRPGIIYKLTLALSAALMLVWSSQFVRGFWVG